MAYDVVFLSSHLVLRILHPGKILQKQDAGLA
jgi:hypothetical protein